MRNPEKREIAGLKIEITPLGFEAQRRAFVILAKAGGPALIEILAGAKTITSLGSDGEAFRKAALSALDRTDDATLDALTEVFGETTRAMFSPKRAPFLSEASAREEAFGGPNFARYFLWLRACVEVNFAPFFGQLFGATDPASKENTQAA